MKYAYIYEDVYFDAAYDPFEYVIKCDGKTIYRGRAYMCPGEDVAHINISQICENYLNNLLPDTWPIDIDPVEGFGSFTNYNGFKLFNLYIITEEEGEETEVLLETYGFRYCWSYDETLSAQSPSMLEEVINGHYSPCMVLWGTVYANNTMDYKNYWSIGYPNEIPGIPYNKEACGHAALYYLNRRGGWDSFLIEGTVKRTDDIQNHDVKHNYVNGTYRHGQERYLNDITRKWELNTSWLSDEESERLADNLIPSTSVYFHNLDTNEIIPVIITDTSIEHKKYSIGRKLVAYKINVQSAQDRIRR